MQTEITIENLQQEVTDLKIKLEAREAEIEKLSKKYEEAKGLHKMYENLYFEKTQRCNKVETFIGIVSMMVDCASAEETTSAASARLDLIKSTIEKFQQL